MAHAVAVSEEHEAKSDEKVLFGFWVYLMTDLLLFAILFAAYAVLRNNNFGGPPASELFSLNVGLLNTLILLTSSFTCGLGMIAAWRRNLKQVLAWFGITFVLGLAFLGIEIYEFAELVHEGQTPQTNAFLSSFFSLVGTHGLHITSGLLWMGVTIGFILKRGLSASNVRKLTLLSLFWHFLDIVWIFIFTLVYLSTFV